MITINKFNITNLSTITLIYINNFNLYNLIDLLYIMALGFLFTYLTLYLMKNGNLGLNMQNKFYLHLYNKQCFNRILFQFIIISLIFIVCMKYQIILLDDATVKVNLDGTTVTLKGNLIEEAFTKLGASGAFATGAKIAHSLVSKSGLPIMGKITSIIGVGTGSGVAFTVSTKTASMFVDNLLAFKTGKVLPQEVSFQVDKIEVSGEGGKSLVNLVKNTATEVNVLAGSAAPDTNVLTGPVLESNVTSAPSLKDQFSSLEGIISKDIFKINTEQVKRGLSHFSNKDLTVRQPVKTDSTEVSSVVDSIEKYTSSKLEEIFSVTNTASTASVSNSNTSTIINCPLEPTETLSLESKAKIISLLSDNLTLQFIVLYLIWMLIFIYTIKLISDRNLYTPYWETKVRSLPLGRYIHIIITKLLNGWRSSSNFWVYFILFFLFIFMCCSTFATYVVLFTLNST